MATVLIQHQERLIYVCSIAAHSQQQRSWLRAYFKPLLRNPAGAAPHVSGDFRPHSTV